MAHIAQDFDSLATFPGAEPPPPRPQRRDVAPEFDGWISVAERLPDLVAAPWRFSVLVLVRVEGQMRAPFIAIDMYCDRSWGWSVHGKRVTHWQPLPSAELDP